jgi:hypothetical protein
MLSVILAGISDFNIYLSERISESPQEVLLDQASLRAFIENNKLANRLEQQLVISWKAKVESDCSGILEPILVSSSVLGIKTIQDLTRWLTKFKKILVPFTIKFFDPSPTTLNIRMFQGLIVWSLMYLIAARNASIDEVFNYLEQTKLGPENKREEWAKNIVSIFKDLT